MSLRLAIREFVTDGFSGSGSLRSDSVEAQPVTGSPAVGQTTRFMVVAFIVVWSRVSRGCVRTTTLSVLGRICRVLFLCKVVCFSSVIYIFLIDLMFL